MTRRTIARTSLGWLNMFGINLGVTRASIKALPRYLRDGRAFKTAMRASGADIHLGRAYPILLDYKNSAGAARGHYFHTAHESR
jgi:hypothetical protein